MNADNGRTVMQERFDLGHEFLREILKLRTETGLHALSGPYQFFTERGQRGALAAMGFDQRDAEKIRPLFDEIPDMTIGKAGVVRGTGEFPGLSDLVENSEHDDGGVGTALPAKSPDRLDVDVQHELQPMKPSSYINKP